MWTYDELAWLKNEVESLAVDYPFLSTEAHELALCIGDAMVDADELDDEDGLTWAERCSAEDPCPVRAAEGGLSCEHSQ
jgi:hypothetical protein